MCGRDSQRFLERIPYRSGFSPWMVLVFFARTVVEASAGQFLAGSVVHATAVACLVAAEDEDLSALAFAGGRFDVAA